MIYDSVDIACRKNTPMASDHECAVSCKDKNTHLNLKELIGLKCFCRSAFNCRWIGLSDNPEYRPNNLESVLTCQAAPKKDRCPPPVHQPIHIIDPVKEEYKHRVI